LKFGLMQVPSRVYNFGGISPKFRFFSFSLVTGRWNFGIFRFKIQKFKKIVKKYVKNMIKN